MAKSKMKRIIFLTIGVISTIMGIIGIFLPIWPTTGFLILASIMFAKSSPKMHAWLLKNRMAGPYLENYHSKRGINLPYKIRTVAMLWAGLIFSSVLVNPLWLYGLFAVIGIGVTWHVLAIKTRPVTTEDKMGFSYNLATCFIIAIFIGAGMFMSHHHLEMFILGMIGGISITLVLLFAIKSRNALGAEKLSSKI